MSVQDTLTLGDTLNFATYVPDYEPGDGWTLKYRLVLRTVGTAISLSSIQDTEDPTRHRVQATAADTAAWTAGYYSWSSWVEKAAEVYGVATGTTRLLPNPRTAGAGYDARTDAQVALDAAKAALAAWTPTSRAYTIGDRRMEFNSPDDIVKVVNYWANEVRREQDAARLASGLKSSRKVYVRLGRA